jgi:lipopolysaccharide export system protein LptA
MRELISILIFSVTVCYPQDEMITVLGDSLVGKIFQGEMIREVYGDVVLTQGNVVITCNKAIQFISRNDAELIGNVIVKQDSLTIFTDEAFYYGDEKKAESFTGVKLDDRKVILTADSGEYYFNEDVAFFRNNVKLYDTTTTLTSDLLTYFRNENRAVAVDNVEIVDPENKIEADSLEHFRDTRITFADNNVKITSLTNNVVIFGNHLEDYSQRYYTIVEEDPLMIQVDTSYTTEMDSITGNTTSIQLDTLIIRAVIMEAYRDTANIFIATDSVKIIRGNFASKNDHTVYYREDEKIVTHKISEERPQPVLWYENTQLTGDSIIIFLRENKIKMLEVNDNAFILSQDEIYIKRYDQISGDRVFIHFYDGRISSTEVFGNVRSIYFLYEDDFPNGLTKSSSQSATINFADSKVDEVRLYGSPTSEYYPENMVEGRELTYTLPQYNLFLNRPGKKELLSNLDLLNDD